MRLGDEAEGVCACLKKKTPRRANDEAVGR